MSERIDHYAAAVEMLKDAQAAQDLSMVGIIAQGAQVHATLALVEQQRIANLIALGAQYEPDVCIICDSEPCVWDEHQSGYGGAELLPEIKEALGL